MLLGIMCCLIFINDTSAKNPEAEADAFFQNHQYSEALDIWYGLVQSGNVGSGVYYNIGVTESLLGKTPEAIIAFEKALRFKPSGKKVNEALAQERKKIEGGVIPVPTFFLKKWIQTGLSFLRPGSWAIMGLIFFLLLIALLIKNNPSLSKNQYKERRLFLTLLSGGILFLSCAGLSYRQIYRSDEAIIVARCIIRQAPSDESPPIREIYPGEKIIMSDQIGNWYQVRLQNLDEGWVKREFLDFILIDGSETAKG